MPFSRYVETGRIAMVSQGPHRGKLVSVVDVIDQRRVLADGLDKVPRQAIRLSQLHITKFRLKFPYGAPTRVVRKAWTAANLDEKWANSMWAKKIANKQKRVQMCDFDRFKLRLARKRRNTLQKAAYRSIKKQTVKKTDTAEK